MSTSLGRGQPLFQELLLLLQPLSVLPFDLNLLLERRLLPNRQLCCDEDASPPPPCSALLVTGWPQLQADRRAVRSPGGQPAAPHQDSPASQREERSSESPRSAAVPESRWMPDEEHCGYGSADNWSQISMASRQDGQRGDRGPESLRASAWGLQGGRRWANLFGAADPPPRTEAAPHRPPGAQGRR